MLVKATDVLAFFPGLDRAKFGTQPLRGGQDAVVTPVPPMVLTDKTGYFAGETVAIRGTGFASGEVVTLRVTHADGAAETGMGHEPFVATVGVDGTFTAEWAVGSHEGAAEFTLSVQSPSGTVQSAAFGRIAFIYTDKFDYLAGETAQISGIGFLPNETVTVRVLHSNGLNDGSGHLPYEIAADAYGKFTLPWFVNPDDSLGAIMRVTATGGSSGLVATTTFTDPPLTLSDSGGADDVSGGTQRDLTAMSVDYTPAPTHIGVTWNWDDTALNGGNTADACGHFDTDGDGNANYALCVTVGGSPAAAQALRLYSCTDLTVLCSSNSLLPGPYASTATASVVPNSDPFGTRPAPVCNDVTALPTSCKTADTVANLSVAISDFVGATSVKLTNVCSYNSQNPGNPQDCIVPPNSGFLTIKKTTVTQLSTSTNFVFNSSVAAQNGATSFSANIAGSQTDVVVANNVTFAPTTTLTLQEVVPAGWTLSSASCTVPSGAATGTLSGDSLSGIKILPGLETVCIFTNAKQNVAPVAVDDTATTPEDTAKDFSQADLKGNDTDVDNTNAELSVTAVSNPTNGTVVLNGDGTVTFTPTADFFGTAGFDYTLSDGSLSDTGHVTVTVTAVNDAPVAVDDTATTPEDTAKNFSQADLKGNDTDVDNTNAELSVTAVSNPTNGTVVLNGDGTVTFTPTADFFGTAGFDYTLSDGSLSDTGHVTVTVTAVNDAPVAVDDTATTPEDTAKNFSQADLKGNDTDVDNTNAELSVTAVSNPTNGTVVLNGDGTVTFTPAADFFGTAGFDYTLSDGSLSDTGHVTVTVTAVNDAPVAVDDTATTPEDTAKNFSQADLKGNDTDVDNTNAELSVTAVSNPTNGTVVLNGDGTVTFTPAADFFGTAGFDYTLSDGSLSDTGHVTVTVTAVNDAPVAVDDTATTPEDTAKNFSQADLKGNDTDVDNTNAELSVTAVSNPTNGTVVLNGDGTVTFTPAADFFGTAGFDYTLSDGTLTDTGHVTVTVTAVNDAPVADAQGVTTAEDTPKAFTLTGSDVDGDALTYIVLTSPTNGTLSGTAPNLTYTPNPNYNGPDSFTFKVNDGTVDSNVATVTITVTPVNDAPTVASNNASVSVDEGQTATNTGTWADIDSAAAAVTLTASVGVVTKNADGTWSWQFATSDGPLQSQVVTIWGNDGSGGITATTFQLSVINVNPVVLMTSPAYGASFAMGSTVVINASFNDPGADAPWVCTINWDGVSVTSGTVNQLTKTCTGSKLLSTPGLYTVTVKVTDKDGGFGIAETLIVVYDPNGSVTGGGWIDSPEGAYTANESLIGRANFGFVSQYKKGTTVPTGQTEFQFQVANLNFHSSVYEWLVVSGCKAQYKGTGTINGVAGYKFLLTATDGDKCAVKSVDKFRIKITDGAGGVVYDNRPGLSDDMNTTEPQEISGGSIAIHQPAGKK